jgi:hypothetical protein
MNTLSENQKRQYSHLARFRESYAGFPEGELQYGDDPDLIVYTTDGALGIEHTQLFWPEPPDEPGAPNRIVMQEQEALEQRIVDQARQIYEQGGGPSLYVTVLFHSFVKLKKKGVDTIAQKLAELVSKANPSLGEHIHLDGSQFGSKRNPSEIVAIFIDRYEGFKETLWAVGRGSPVPDLTPTQISDTIQTKDFKINEYRIKCSKIWLLMVEDGFTPSSDFEIQDAVTHHLYRSGFDRIFLFRNFSRKIIELQVQH